MANVEKLNAVFTEEFIRNHKDVGNIDDLYDEVVKVDSSISREEYDGYVTALSEQMRSEELGDAQLENVSGGFAWTTVAGVCGLLTFCYKGGEAIGKGIYYLTHR